MRVVMVILEYWPSTGGAQRQLAALAPLLARGGAEIEVITRRAPGLAAREIVDGVPVHRLPAPGPKALASLWFTLAAVWRLRALRPDVVHAYSLFSPATIGALAHTVLGVPVVVKVLRGGRLGDVERLRRKPLARRRIAWLRRAVHRFVVISREIAEELEALGVPASQRVAIPNGVDVARFRPREDGGAGAVGRAAAAAVDGAPTAVYAGRLVPEKRVDRLIAAWPAVRARVPGARLRVIGDGPCAAELARAAGPGVSLEGAVADVAPALAEADVFVLPSATEGLSNALLEAMAAGLAVVATRVGGAAEVVEDGGSGRLVPVDDDDALVEALVGLLRPDAAATRAALGRAARARMVADFALPAVAARLLDLYREAARPDASPATVSGAGAPRGQGATR